MIFVCILAALIVIYLGITLFLVHKFSYMVLTPKTHTYESLLEECLQNGKFTQEYIDGLTPENITIQSRYGYELKGIILDNEVSRRPEYASRVAVICHGYTAAKLSMHNYALMLMNMGFTCVMYDHRNHGETGKVAYTTMGFYEKYDLQTIVDYCYERFGSDIRLLTYGESMGSATVLSHLEIDTRPVMTVADCGYSDLTDLFHYMLSDVFHVPGIFPILPLANRILARKGHFLMEQVSPIRGVRRAGSPILFIHGLADTFIPCRMSEEMSKAGSGVRELFLCPNAEHALSDVTEPEAYLEVLTNFVNRYY